MQYAARDLTPHERYKIVTSFVLPRPIAWLTTLGADGTVNGAGRVVLDLAGGLLALAFLLLATAGVLSFHLVSLARP